MFFKAVRRPKALGGALMPKRPKADALKTMRITVYKLAEIRAINSKSDGKAEAIFFPAES